MQTNLPAKITEINTEKGDTALTVIDNSNYFTNFYQMELTPSRFIHYGLLDPVVESVRGDFATTWTVFYVVFIEDQNNLPDVRKTILRYTRALYEVLEENCDEISRYCTIPEISSLTPGDVGLSWGDNLDDKTPFKVGGATIKVIMA
jgi:hypothetical protein